MQKEDPKPPSIVNLIELKSGELATYEGYDLKIDPPKVIVRRVQFEKGKTFLGPRENIDHSDIAT
jgi:hypothetical protein